MPYVVRSAQVGSYAIRGSKGTVYPYVCMATRALACTRVGTKGFCMRGTNCLAGGDHTRCGPASSARARACALLPRVGLGMLTEGGAGFISFSLVLS